MDRQKNQNKGSSAGFYPLIRRNSSAGMTIVETLIATVIVVITMYVAASYFSSQGNQVRTLAGGGSCKAALESQMGFFRQQSLAPFANDWTVQGPPGFIGPVEIARPLGTTPGAAGASIANSTDLLEDDGSGVYVIRSALLQKSTVGAIASIYNSTNTCVFRPVPPSVPAPVTGIPGFASTIKIETYNLDDGSASCIKGTASAPLILKPRPVAVSDVELMPNPKIVKFPPNVNDDLGYRVTLNGSYQEEGITRNCSLTEDFRFPVDHEVKSPSVIRNFLDSNDIANMSVATEISNANLACPKSATKSGRTQCTQPANIPGNLTLKIGFRDNVKAEPGVMFMCRDTSVQMYPNGYCRGPDFNNSTGLNAAMQGNPSANPAAPWVPCDRVTACGVAPGIGAAAGSFDPINNQYTLNYAGAGLWGCDIKIDVASVDLAGNYKKLSDQFIPGTNISADSALKYFQGPPCWACYKKKQNWGGFLLVALALGPFGVAVAAAGLATYCAVGNCVPKSYRFTNNACVNQHPGGGKRFCQEKPMRAPAWWSNPAARTPACSANSVSDTPGLPCDPMSVAYPVATAGVANFAAAKDGDFQEFNVPLPNVGLLCDAAALCTNGVWKPIDLDDGTAGKFTSCNKVIVRKRIDIKGPPAVPVGQVPNAVTNVVTECTYPVPQTMVIPAQFSFNYFINGVPGGFKVCSPAQTGLTENTICKTGAGPFGALPALAQFPKDASGVYIKDPEKYYFYEHVIPTPQSPPLPQCLDEAPP